MTRWILCDDCWKQFAQLPRKVMGAGFIKHVGGTLLIEANCDTCGKLIALASTTHAVSIVRAEGLPYSPWEDRWVIPHPQVQRWELYDKFTKRHVATIVAPEMPGTPQSGWRTFGGRPFTDFRIVKT